VTTVLVLVAVEIEKPSGVLGIKNAFEKALREKGAGKRLSGCY